MSYPVVTFQTVSASAPVVSVPLDYVASAPYALPAVDAADTLTAALLVANSVFRKDVTLTANRALTLPSAAALVAAIPGAVVGTTLEFCVSTGNLSVNGDVVVTAGTGGTVVGAAAVDTASQGCFRVRLSNVSSGTAAYTVTRL